MAAATFSISPTGLTDLDLPLVSFVSSLLKYSRGIVSSTVDI